jgi:hypothetical protein
MENVGTFYANSENIMAIWYIIWSFGNFVEIFYIFHRFGILCQEKSGNPELQSEWLHLSIIDPSMS